MSHDIRLTFRLSSPPERVMQLLTDTALIRRWSGSEAVLEKHTGGRFEMFDGWVNGAVETATDTELSYTWKTTDWDENALPSKVYYLLAPAEDSGTTVTLLHTGLPNEQEMKEHAAGWSDYFFEPMEDYIMAFDQRG